MTISTANDLITLALKTAGVLGVGQTAAAEDQNDVFDMLNMMLGEWNRERWLVYHLVDTAFMSTGANSYTVGPGCNFNIARIDRIESGFARMNPTSSNPIDFPLGIIQSREDYNSIGLKELQSFPTAMFLDSNNPTGTIYFWPVPPSGEYEMHISTKDPLTAFASLTTTIALPPEYFGCLLWNLSVRIAPLYGIALRPDVVALARTSLMTLRTANAQIPSLSLPGILLPRRGGIDPTLGGFNGLPWSF